MSNAAITRENDERESEYRGIFFRFFEIRLAVGVFDVLFHPFVAQIFFFIRSFFLLLRRSVDWSHA